MRITRMMLALSAACGGGAADSGAGPGPGPVTPACAAMPGVGVSATTSGVVSIWAVLPRSTDSCISTNLDSHFVYRVPTATPTGRLLVFLPGTGAIAQYYKLVLAQASQNGYHAVGITYPNDQAVGVLCATQPTSCHGDTRLEILTGQATSTVVAVARVNSIENRLVKLLAFMQLTEPAGSWSQFLVGDTAVNWSKVSIAGHSQGGGHALFIAQRYAVWRATAYSSAGDLIAGGAPAPWVTLAYATPTDRLYGFISSADELVQPAATIATWGTIGMGAFGAPVSVDTAGPPFGGTHRLTTTATPANPGVAIGPNHNAVVVDANTPKVAVGSTTPVFAVVWRYLSFP